MTLNAETKWNMALSAETEKWCSKCRNWETMVALNTKNWRSGFERQNWETMVALNAKIGEVALNIELIVWHDDFKCRKHWMNGGSERQTARKWWGRNMPQCSMPPQCSIQRKWLKGTLRVSNNAPLASWDNQIDYEHSLTTLPTKSWGLNLKVTIQWRVMASRAIRTWTLRSTKSSSWRKSQEQQSVRQIQYISAEWWKLQWICERTIASMTKWGKYVPV